VWFRPTRLWIHPWMNWSSRWSLRRRESTVWMQPQPHSRPWGTSIYAWVHLGLNDIIHKIVTRVLELERMTPPVWSGVNDLLPILRILFKGPRLHKLDFPNFDRITPNGETSCTFNYIMFKHICGYMFPLHFRGASTLWLQTYKSLHRVFTWLELCVNVFAKFNGDKYARITSGLFVHKNLFYTVCSQIQGTDA
jgi:hypothetical protein